MSNIVEGQWKNFVFKMITPENKTKVYPHLRKNFYEDETICKYFGGSTDWCAKEFETFYDTVIPENLSFFAMDKETGEVAGVRMTMIQVKETDFSKFNFSSPQVASAVKVTGMIDHETNFLERFGVNEVVNFVAASTDRKYRGMGLATEMYRRSIALLKSKGYKHVKSVITSPYTRKALQNLGFKEGAKIYYKDIQNDDGTPMFPNLAKDLFANFMYFEL